MIRRSIANVLLAVAATGGPLSAAGQEEAMSAEDEVRALQGSEFGRTLQDARLFSHLSCTLTAMGQLTVKNRVRPGWDYALAHCQGRYVMLLLQDLNVKSDMDNRWRIADTKLLPKVIGIEDDPNRPYGLYLFTPDECQISGNWGTKFYVVVRQSGRKRMDWRTGVEGVWSYDLNRKRIVSLSPRRVVCEKPDPD